MSAENDFLKARTQITAKIQKLETDLKYWREELQAFGRVETTMRRLVGSGGNGEATELKLEADRLAEPKTSESNFAAEIAAAQLAGADAARKRGDLKKLILAWVRERRGTKVSATDVERGILQTGFKPRGKNFDVAVYQTLKRLAEANVIKRKKYAGNVKFIADTE
jgi:hypothetical protein